MIKKIECNSCVLYNQLKFDCYTLRDNADDKNGYCKFYKSNEEYEMRYNDIVGAYCPVKK